MFTTIISTPALAENLQNPSWTILDCRYTLADPNQGESEYILAHIPGAVYVHLDRHLSAPVIPKKTGRHPLPDPDQAASFFAQIGIGDETQVVVYDAAGGASAAGRAWWMLRWLGHEAVAVLDGGWIKWRGEDRPTQSGVEIHSPRQFRAALNSKMTVDAEEVESIIHRTDFRLLDSRSADRYRGENEVIDPVAGHIPGALSLPYAENLNPDGTFRSREALNKRFQSAIGLIPVDQVVFYCGSGVTAAHNILAVAHAGLGMPRLYVGSWSEWIVDPGRPIER